MYNQFKEPKVFINLRCADKQDRPQPIYFIVSHEGKRWKRSVEVKVKPSQWNKRRRQAIISANYSAIDNYNNKEANKKIREIEDSYSDFLSYFCSDFENNISKFEEIIIEKFMSTKKEKKSVNKFDKADLLKLIPTDLSTGSYSNYKNIINKVWDYITTENIDRDWKNLISFSFFSGFEKYLLKNLKARSGNDGISVAVLNSYLNSTYFLLEGKVKDGTIKRSDYIDAKPTVKKDKASKDDIPFLYESEIIQLYNCPIDSPEKDMFLLECLTGQRFSDLSKISVEENNGVKFLYLTTKKTSEIVRCKVYFKLTLDIIEKYNGGVPKVSISSLNKNIKIIARKAGLTRNWVKQIHVAGEAKPKVETFELCDIISSHTGRHTFDSILKIRGVASEVISEYSGHSPKMVEDYTRSVKIVDKDIYTNSSESDRLEVITYCREEKPVKKEVTEEYDEEEDDELLGNKMKVYSRMKRKPLRW